MQTTAFAFRVESSIAHLTLDQGPRGNPIDEAFCRELKLLAIECDENPAVRAVLIEARGKNFSVGGDLKTFVRQRATLPALTKAMTADLNSGVARLARMNAPVIIALHGLVTGGAVAFTAAADFAVATADAKFYAAFTGIGFSCDCGTSFYLPRKVGQRRALDFLLRNRLWSASQALEFGLVNELTPDEPALRETSHALAVELASGPTRAYGEIKRLFHSSFAQPLEAQLEDEAQAIARCTRTEDAWQALNTVMAKQKPVFNGR
ncbi:MAG: enoyl-CoA hydratase/isomerase family protein [Gammaproteobacteria bacterium]|nr:enoyl-CoA hydratase/isomerase family protein [Gammaproteobacteria bacterium]